MKYLHKVENWRDWALAWLAIFVPFFGMCIIYAELPGSYRVPFVAFCSILWARMRMSMQERIALASVDQPGELASVDQPGELAGGELAADEVKP